MGLAQSPSAADMMVLIDYTLNAVGEAAVGVGSDMWFGQDGVDETPPESLTGAPFDPHYWWPESFDYDHSGTALGGGYMEPQEWRVLPGLLDKRYGERVADLILGQNMKRVAAQVWC